MALRRLQDALRTFALGDAHRTPGGCPIDIKVIPNGSRHLPLSLRPHQAH